MKALEDLNYLLTIDEQFFWENYSKLFLTQSIKVKDDLNSFTKNLMIEFKLRALDAKVS